MLVVQALSKAIAMYAERVAVSERSSISTLCQITRGEVNRFG
jgi:hypothetical protein